jgi:integrase
MSKLSNPYCRKSSNTWLAKVDGKPRQLVPKGWTEEQARAAWQTLKLRIDAENLEAQTAVEDQWVSSWIRKYLAQVEKEVSPRWLAQKKQWLGDFARHHGAKPLNTITPQMVREWVEGHKGWNQTTRSIAYRLLNAFFNRLTEWGINHNPVRAVKNKPQSLVRGENALIPAHECQAVFNASSEPYRTIFELLWETGARPSEILGLTAEEIVSFACEHSSASKKEIVKLSHKTSKLGKDRVILLTSRASQLIEEALKAHPTGLLFPSKSGRLLSSSYLAQVLLNTKQKLCQTSTWTPYSFRHSFICRHLERRVEIYTVASWAGNSVAVLERHYAKAIKHARSTAHLLEDSQPAA